MTTKVIPEQKQVTCDVCLADITGKNHGYLRLMGAAGEDYSGHAVGPGIFVHIDLCKYCEFGVTVIIREHIKKMQEKK